MRLLSLQEIQKAEYNILLLFKKLCEENHLYYTLAGGTLLGAVRHHGFIPWDDDIDVLMPRPDFDRLLNMQNINTEMLPNYIKISNWRQPDGETVPFVKMIDTRIIVNDEYSHMDNNLWIDVFPIDGCPENDDELQEFYKKVLLKRRILLLKNAKIGKGKSLFKRITKPFVLLLLSPFQTQKLCDDYDKYAKTYDFNKSGCIAGITWGYGPQERIDKEAYLTPVRLQFEGEEFNAPSNYDQYLTGLYHDYMQLPPEEQRQTRHDITVYLKDDEE